MVSPLTSEATLGIDFLQAQKAVIDLGCGVLHLQEGECDIHLDPPMPMQSCQAIQSVHCPNTVEVPPCSMMEIPAYLDTEVGVWLVEETTSKYLPVAIARAVVEPHTATIPVYALNMSDQTATLYAGTVVDTMLPAVVYSGVANIEEEPGSPEVDREVQQVIQQLVDNTSTELSQGEKGMFYNLLLTYSELFGYLYHRAW